MQKSSSKGKVFVGVSGGVDSSVALALLQKDGYDVTGVFLKVWHPDFLPCDWREERRSAMRVCATLNVPFITLDCEAEYKKEVVDYMIREYSVGRVPNPDIFCNKYVKFGVFLNKAREMGADYIATGHYAQKLGTSDKVLGSSKVRSYLTSPYNLEPRTYHLSEAKDKNKDQSYFLYTLDQGQLSHTLFPIGGMTKPEVRKLAEKVGLPTAAKKDSQGLCFIGKVDMKDFLKHFIETKIGDVLNTKEEVVGTHDGAMFYTIGQRHGFTITKKSPDEPRFFVVSKDMEKNTITVAAENSEAIYSVKEIIVPNMHFISRKEPDFTQKISARIRYRQEKQICTLDKRSDGYYIIFDTLQSAVPVGQSVVLYNGEICLGGGIIEKVT